MGRPQARPAMVWGDDGLKDGGGQVLPRGSLVDERLDVGLGEDTAARGDGVERRVARGQVVQTGGIGVKELGHLVDEGTGTARTGAVHALLRGGMEVGDLGVLTTSSMTTSACGSHTRTVSVSAMTSWTKGQTHERGQGQPGTAGDRPAHDGARIGPSDLAQQPGQLTAHVRVVAPVLSKHRRHRTPRHRVGPGTRRRLGQTLREKDQLDGGRADVQPHPQDRGAVCRGTTVTARVHRLRSRPVVAEEANLREMETGSGTDMLHLGARYADLL